MVQAFDGAMLDGLSMALVKVVAAQVTIIVMASDETVTSDEQAVGDGNGGTLFAEAAGPGDDREHDSTCS